jgi:hypothetical protein
MVTSDCRLQIAKEQVDYLLVVGISDRRPKYRLFFRSPRCCSAQLGSTI